MIKLIDILRELNTRDKEMLGQGLEHNVYPSQDPNKVVKVGETRYVDKWVKDFKSRPDLFPKIYKVGKLKDDPKRSYVVMERLDTEQFMVDFEVLESILEDFSHWGVLGAIEAGEHKEKVWDWIYNKIKEQDEEIADFFAKLYNNVVQTKPFKKWSLDVYDFHKGQFGYDKKGNVKMLDY